MLPQDSKRENNFEQAKIFASLSYLMLVKSVLQTFKGQRK